MYCTSFIMSSVTICYDTEYKYDLHAILAPYIDRDYC